MEGLRDTALCRDPLVRVTPVVAVQSLTGVFYLGDHMTTKQISDATGKAERTVQRWVKKIISDAKEKGAMPPLVSSMNVKMTSSTSTYPADYSFEETCAIIEKGLGANAASVYRMNAEQKAIATSRDSAAMLAESFRVMTAQTAAIMEMLQETRSRVDKVEYQQHQRAALLPAPQKDARSELTQLVNKHAHQNHGNDHRAAWKELYTEIYYRLHINVRKRAKNEGVKGVDILAREGLLETACAIIGELLGGEV